MADPLSYIMSLDLDIQQPARVLEAGAREFVRRHYVPTIEEARAHIAGDVAKALTVLLDLVDLTADGAVVVRVQIVNCTPDPLRLPGPQVRALPAPDAGS